MGQDCRPQSEVSPLASCKAEVPVWRAAMTNIPSSHDAQAYLENLMRAGQDAMKQFDDALASAAGVRGKDANPSGHFFSPFGLIADLQREYLKQLWRFWNTTFLQ